MDFSKIKDCPKSLPKLFIEMYCIVFKNDSKCEWKYGRKNYDFQEGTLVFLAPGQVLEIEINENKKDNSGWALIFHPDLIRHSKLNIHSPEYSFFSYDVYEALHISEAEKLTLIESLKKIDHELSINIDKHSQRLIVSNIELLLNYCVRYYDRQFITRCASNKDLISKFEHFLNDYFNSEQLAEKGIPDVSFCAGAMNLSANYLSDLLKKETGKTTLEHIHYHLIEKAKDLLLGSECTIREIAFDLGFEYPQHFNKIFKNKTGITPSKYRQTN